MAILEGAWDCSQCRAVAIPGGLTNCPHCNDPRNTIIDPEESPYLPTNARVVTDSDKLADANTGPEWNCGDCGQANRGNATVCSSCNQPKSADDTVAGVYTYVSGVEADGEALSDPRAIEDDWVNTVLTAADPLQEIAEGPVAMPAHTFASDALPDEGSDIKQLFATDDRSHDTRRNTPSFARLRSFPMPTLAKAAAAAVLVVAAIFTGFFVHGEFFATYSAPLTVQNLTWERQVEVEAYRTLTEEDWSYPSDARVLGSRQAIHHYNQVLDHYDKKSREVPERVQSGSHSESYACGSRTVNRGNGYFEQQTTYCTRSVPDYTTRYRTEYYDEPVYRQVPIYQTKYTYEIDRWVTDRFEVASGESTDDGVWPVWPEPKIADAKLRVGDERRERYEVALADASGRQFTQQLDLGTWDNLSEGETVAGHQTKHGDLRGVDWPSE